jgi:hypothetical protein
VLGFVLHERVPCFLAFILLFLNRGTRILERFAGFVDKRVRRSKKLQCFFVVCFSKADSLLADR